MVWNLPRFSTIEPAHFSKWHFFRPPWIARRPVLDISILEPRYRPSMFFYAQSDTNSNWTMASKFHHHFDSGRLVRICHAQLIAHRSLVEPSAIRSAKSTAPMTDKAVWNFPQTCYFGYNSWSTTIDSVVTNQPVRKYCEVAQKIVKYFIWNSAENCVEVVQNFHIR